MPDDWTPAYLPLTPALKVFVTNLAWQSQGHIIRPWRIDAWALQGEVHGR